MIRTLFFFLSCALMIGSCTTPEKPKEKDVPISDKMKIGDHVCFNHSLLFLDSITYEAAVNSEFINQFAFSHEKQLTGFSGFYLIGKTNYLELFHPGSIEGEYWQPGEIWICLASLKANYLQQLNKKKRNFMKYESDESYHSLSLAVDNTDSPITVREMRKGQYESWTKKEFNDSVDFLPVDYNSPEESDSSSNYLMNDVYGIGLSMHPKDSLLLVNYLREIGYDSFSEFDGKTRISNNDQFFELHMSKENNSFSINRYYIHLNQSVEQSTEIVGNSRIECDGNSAIWIFE